MTESLMAQFDYSSLNLKSLQYLYQKKPKDEAVKHRVFSAIVTQFFEMRKSGNNTLILRIPFYYTTQVIGI